MANTILPVEERLLTPDEVAALDKRRRIGHLYLCMGWQFLLVALFVTLWSGQDATYSPRWTHPMLYWDILVFIASMVFFAKALTMRRGVNEFFSY